ncbi:MAG: acyl-CoA thioesterase FadM [Moritella sp.]|jgi:acyl-CoA thioesterase FadM
MILVYLKTGMRGVISTDDLSCELTMRVLPNDLDVNMHMNNGRFLTICDLSRLDLFIRTGLTKLMVKHKWAPIIAHHDMNYFKPLKPFQKYTVRLSIDSWDDKYFYCTHTFTSQGKVYAKGSSKAVVRSKEGVLAPGMVVDLVDEIQQTEQLV